MHKSYPPEIILMYSKLGLEFSEFNEQFRHNKIQELKQKYGNAISYMEYPVDLNKIYCCRKCNP